MSNPADIIRSAIQQGRTALLEHEARELVRSAGIITAKYELAESDNDSAILAAAGRLGFPVAVKAISAGILHKTEAGAVLLDIKTPVELATAVKQIKMNVAARAEGASISFFLIEKMMPAGPEFLIGGLRDEQFGPAVAFGLGGIFAEVLKDVVFGILPLTDNERIAMIDRTRAGALFKGFRGAAALDRTPVLVLMTAVGRLMIDYPEIQEIDLNPVRIYGRGAAALDVRVLIRR